MSDKVKKILIVNVWGENRGDEAMINSLYNILCSVVKDVSVDIMLFKKTSLDVNKKINLIPNRLGIYYYSSFSFMFRWLDRRKDNYFILGLTYKVFLLMARYFGFLDLLFIKKYDLILSAPQGPTIGDSYPYKRKTLYPLNIARILKVPYAILGVSMGPFDKKSKHEKWVLSILNKAEKIITREDISYKNVHQKYPTLTNTSSAIDVVFASRVDLSNKPIKIKVNYENFCSVLDKGSIGACISLTPSEGMTFDKRSYIDKIINFFDYVADSTSRNLILFPHLSFDMPALFQIVKSASNSSRMTIFNADYDSDFQQDLIRQLYFFISSRYHPTIFAIKSATPFMCIKNNFKTEGMLQKLNLDVNNCWQDDDISKFKNMFNKCWDSRPFQVCSIIRAKEIAFNESQKYEAYLREMLQHKHVA